MSKVFITGDIHGNPNKFSTKIFPQKHLTKDDYVIILGDFGLVWSHDGENNEERYWLNWLEEKPFTTLFIDGNHENYDRLNSYSIEKWHGGDVHKIRPSVIHLIRGNIFDIDGYKFLAMGGAASHDITDGILDVEKDLNKIKKWNRDRSKLFRVNHWSWWKEEIPSQEERDLACDNIKKARYNIDYILTHEGPASTLLVGFGSFYKPDEYSIFLEHLRQLINYKHWYFGHYHCDKIINDRETVLYDRIERIL